MANPQPSQTSFAMMTNGDDILFVKLTQIKHRQYDVSRVFATFSSNQEIYNVLQVLKSLGRVI
jgi:hypothetical protein